jgi:hypothetical protein
VERWNRTPTLENMHRLVLVIPIINELRLDTTAPNSSTTSLRPRSDAV